ncbi:hypothetical protein AKJ54_00380 [candidate division MSBL1 archaeon SCGC-AAA382K21]|uniref:Uncharacterized protein n=1 Tax=candidate division MSBL1 archaeon SCGC-AAA382K21 TaxID=1698283 RepID=A0A133VLQ9_9EURY|nr:hypothetical protein AKJ54_00380 [candidate division MSBL1 archaeon SCGC-AAA382K21]
MTCYYCLHCLKKIKSRKEDRAGKVQCRNCGRRRTVTCKTLKSAVNHIEDLPTPIENLGTFEKPLEKIVQFPVLKLLLESDARLKEPIQYLSTRVGLIHENLRKMSSNKTLNEDKFESAVEKTRKTLREEGVM